MKRIRHFLTSDRAAVTADWLVMTGLMIGLALAAFNAVSSPTDTLAKETIDAIEVRQ